jgi:hypothetical protein
MSRSLQAPSMRSPNQSVHQSHTKPSSSSPSLAVRLPLSPLPPLHASLTRASPTTTRGPQERQGILTVSASTSTHSVICESSNSCNSCLRVYSVWPLTFGLQLPDRAFRVCSKCQVTLRFPTPIRAIGLATIAPLFSRSQVCVSSYPWK